jgi:hypothetical protein
MTGSSTELASLISPYQIDAMRRKSIVASDMLPLHFESESGGSGSMFAQALAGFTLLVSVSANPGATAPDANGLATDVTAQEKRAIIRPLVKSATDCVARTVAADPRLGKANVTDLIVDSFKYCGEPVRALIDAHDRYYGAGTGEQFFMGPYLDALPAAVTSIVSGKSEQPPR